MCEFIVSLRKESQDEKSLTQKLPLELMNSGCQQVKYGHVSLLADFWAPLPCCLHIPTSPPDLDGFKDVHVVNTLIRNAPPPPRFHVGCPVARGWVHHRGNVLPPADPGRRFMGSTWWHNSLPGKWFYVVLCVFLSFSSRINGIVPSGKNYCLRPQARLAVALSLQLPALQTPSECVLKRESRQARVPRGNRV